MSAQRLFELLVVALACAACQVGDPLVDVVDASGGGLAITCNYPPTCTPVERGEAQELAAVPVQVECAQTCIWQTASGDSESCPPNILDRPPSSAHCMNIELQPAANTAELRASEVDWQDTNVSLRAQTPLTLWLRGGALQRTYFELEGPITLRVEAVQQFDDLRIVGRSTPAGSPQFVLAAERGSSFSVGSAQAPFPGEVRLAAGVYETVDVHTMAFTAESATMRGVKLQAETITLTDVTMERALVETKHALWSAFIATDAGLRFCGDTRLITGQMARCSITTCETASVRMYDVSFVSGSLDGDYEMSDTNLENVQLAPLAATRVFAYGTALTSVNMCEHMQQLVLGTGSRIKCSACAEELAAELPVCAVEEPIDKWLQNYCTGWRAEDPLPLCTEDTPIRAKRAR